MKLNFDASDQFKEREKFYEERNFQIDFEKLKLNRFLMTIVTLKIKIKGVTSLVFSLRSIFLFTVTSFFLQKKKLKHN